MAAAVPPSPAFPSSRPSPSLEAGRDPSRSDPYPNPRMPARSAVHSRILRFPGGVRRDPAIAGWMHAHEGELGTIARQWFDVIRARGADVRELLHDGHPTACVGDAAFASVNAFRAHVNVGFFRGAELPDPAGLLEGTGTYMRHVKLRPDAAVDAGALTELIQAAYTDMKRRLEGSMG